MFSSFFRGGLYSQEDSFGTLSHNFQPKSRLKNWEEDQIFIPQYPSAPLPPHGVDNIIKQEASSQNSINLLGSTRHGDEEFQPQAPSSSRPAWSPVQIMPVSSPRSCVTSSSNTNNILDFSYNKTDNKRNQHADISSEVIKGELYSFQYIYIYIYIVFFNFCLDVR